MNLLYGNGEVVLEENTEVVGLQIHFMGKINVISKLPDNFNVSVSAITIHLVGIYCSRWLFFAEAKHSVSFYY